ncbi:MAG: FAD-binding oxidoreductase [Alphaproteobacteria bacterium]|nr:FAD-binding oxidoreductase [Alphaproteobacteria bacterium]
MRQASVAEAAPVDPALLARLRAVVGEAGWVDQPDAIAPYVLDQRRLWLGRTPVVLRPASTAEVAAIVRHCAAASVAIVPQGGNTGLLGGSVPDQSGREIVVNLGRMNRIREIDPLNYAMTVEAGCILAELQAAAESADRLFPLSLGAEGSCQIGGNLSTNAGGVNVLRYGNARELALGLEVVLPDGSIWDGLRALRKDNTGYDLKHLFLGAEGTLGIITAAVVKMFPRPRDVQTALIAVRDAGAACELLADLRVASGESVTGFEYMPRICFDIVFRHLKGLRDPMARAYDHYVLAELSAGRATGALREALEVVLAEALEKGQVIDAVIAESTAQAKAMWAIRHGIPEANRHEGAVIRHDVAVPVSRIAEFIATASTAVRDRYPAMRILAFGHLGDGNVHFNINQPEGGDPAAHLAEWEAVHRIVHDIVVGMRGSFSAEHGIGRFKRAELERYKSPVELALMRRIKGLLDPGGIMNPGKVV